MDSEEENVSDGEGEDYDMSFEDDDKEEFVEEWGAHERVSMRKTFKDTFIEPSTDQEFFLSELHKNMGKLYAESDNRVSISNSDIETIIDMIDKIHHIQYKNALAFLAGYYVLDGKQIDQKKLNYIATLLTDEKVNKVDVIRYARLITSLQSK